MTDQCSTCCFWIALASEDDEVSMVIHHRTTGYTDAQGDTGLCRRMPPVCGKLEDHAADAAGASRWPVTWDDDWCGEHRTDEGGGE